MGPKCQKLARKSLLMQKASIFLLPSTFHNINIWSQRFFHFFYFCWLCSKSTRKFMKATLIRVGHYTFQGIRAAQQQQFSQQSHQPYFWSQLQFQAFSILNEKRHTHTQFGEIFRLKYELTLFGVSMILPQWLKAIQNVAFEFLNFDIFHQFWPV